MFESDVILLLGAGASIPTGIPGMAGMAEDLDASLDSGSDAAKGLETLRSLSTPDDVEEFLQLANEVIAFAGSPLEELVVDCVSPREGSSMLDKYHRRLSQHADEVSAFRRELLSFINAVCLRFDRQKAKDIYGDIVKALYKNGIPVFTTNYDSLLDHVASQVGIPVADNFAPDQSGRRFFWDRSLKAFNSEGIPIVKMHGSITWHATPDGKVERIPIPAEINEEGRPLTRLMIFPTRFKDIYRQNYFPLYTAFTRTLATSRALVVIGHSLRDEYILAAIRERLRAAEFQIVVVGPGFPKRKELEEDVENASDRIVHLRRGIQTVYPLVLQLLRDLSPNTVSARTREAADRLSRGETDKIRVSNMPQWVNEGESIQCDVEVDTVVGGGILKVWVEPNKNRKKRIYITPSFPDSRKNNWRIDGIRDEQVAIRFELPDELDPGRHRVVVAIERNEDEDIARSESIVGIRMG